MNEANNDYPFNMDKPNIDEAFYSRKLDADDGCELDRSINRRKHRSHCNDAYSNAHYRRCTVSSNDDTSNKRKVISGTDVSTTSFTQTSRTSATKPNDINISIHISTLDMLGNVG